MDAVLDRVQLLRRADTPARDFSGGMKRRLSVAMSVVGEVDIVFLDGNCEGISCHQFFLAHYSFILLLYQVVCRFQMYGFNVAYKDPYVCVCVCEILQIRKSVSLLPTSVLSVITIK